MPKGSAKRAVKLYRFNVKKMSKKQEMQIATRQDQIAEVLRDKEIGKLLKRGKSYEEISVELGITTNEAFDLTRKVVAKWSGELSMTANEVREVQVKQLDALESLLTSQAFPHPIIDMNTGEPQLYPNGEVIMTDPDHSAIKLLMDVKERRAKLLGLDAADKLREKLVDRMERKYIGADPDAL